MIEEPLILTLELDSDSFEWLNDLRKSYFPKQRNLLSAHLTLFHKLTLAQVEFMKAVLWRSPSGVVPLEFVGLRSLGGGVAVDVHAPDLVALRKTFVAAVDGDLTPQDGQGFRPHVTIQNKVTAAVARQTLATLQRDFTPRAGQGTALMVWRYLGGPWALHERLELL